MKRSLKVSLMRSLCWFKNYFLSFISLIIVMAAIKNTSSVQRPFFLDICKPDLAVNCTTGTFLSADYKCTNTEASDFMISETTRSFPSGHVVYVVYASCVFMWYLQRRISKFPLVLTLTHLLCLLWMAYCSVTRVTDNWHHVSDVIGSAVISLPFVLFNVSFYFFVKK